MILIKVNWFWSINSILREIRICSFYDKSELILRLRICKGQWVNNRYYYVQINVWQLGNISQLFSYIQNSIYWQRGILFSCTIVNLFLCIYYILYFGKFIQNMFNFCFQLKRSVYMGARLNTPNRKMEDLPIKLTNWPLRTRLWSSSLVFLIVTAITTIIAICLSIYCTLYYITCPLRPMKKI